MGNDKNIVLWCGSQANQKALANNLFQEGLLSAVVIEEPKSNQKKTLFSYFGKVFDRIIFYPIHQAWFKMLKFYDKQFKDWPNVEILKVENINSEVCFNYTNQKEPDIILVSGTRLVKKRMFDLKPTIGIINLHTGLSPYIKGGPNCTNWCLAIGQPQLIGNTIMWLNKGIDSGNIISTEISKLNNRQSFNDIHIQVMNDAHKLYIKAVNHLLNKSMVEWNNIKQSEIGEGRLFLTKMWDFNMKFRLLVKIKLKQYKKDISQAELNIDTNTIRTISIE